MTFFPTLPDEARVWLFAADRALTPEQGAALESRVAAFVADWSSHGRRVEGAARVVDGRVLVLAGHIPGADVSGCGIDKSVHVLEEAAEALGFAWASGMNVVYRTPAGALEVVQRPVFRAAARQGEVDAATPVVDLSVSSLGDLRRDGLERPAGESWHGMVFGLVPAPAAP